MRALVGLIFLSSALSCEAEGLAMVHSGGIVTVEALVFCKPADEGVRVPAPDTALGYIMSTDVQDFHARPGQTVPAALGLSFGVRALAARYVSEVRVVLHRPGLATPDIWYDTFLAGGEEMNFFTFDFPAEQVPGLWTFEAWDGDEQLYRVEFSVVPENALPDEVARCRAMS